MCPHGIDINESFRKIWKERGNNLFLHYFCSCLGKADLMHKQQVFARCQEGNQVIGAVLLWVRRERDGDIRLEL